MKTPDDLTPLTGEIMKAASVYDRRPWLNHYENGVPHEIPLTNGLLPDLLEKNAKLFPNNSALNFEGYRVSYSKLNSMVD